MKRLPAACKSIYQRLYRATAYLGVLLKPCGAPEMDNTACRSNRALHTICKRLCCCHDSAAEVKLSCIICEGNQQRYKRECPIPTYACEYLPISYIFQPGRLHHGSHLQLLGMPAPEKLPRRNGSMHSMRS